LAVTALKQFSGWENDTTSAEKPFAGYIFKQAENAIAVLQNLHQKFAIIEFKQQQTAPL
jgi:hypothetical protein